MLVVGLTGGIGSGKSAVAERFAARGIPVVDTDLIAHQLLRDAAIRDALVQRFGSEILDAGGEIDRRKLGRHVFGDDEALRALEAQLHPRIRDEVAQRLHELDADYAIVVVPLLVEKGRYEFIDRVLLVDCDEALQRERAMARDGDSREQIQAIMDHQASREDRRRLADDLIDNSGSLADLDAQVARLDAQYRQAGRA